MSEIQWDTELAAKSVSPLPQEELANTVTHGLGTAFSLAGVFALAALLESVPRGLAVSCLVYGATLVLVFAVSTISHAVREARAKHLWRIWDQGLIYTLIAGTYTPFVWAYAPPATRDFVLAAIWAAALLGVFVKVVLQHRVGATTTYSYLLLGWLPALSIANRVPLAAALGMLLGGLLYTAGTFFLKRDDQFRFFHAFWHLLVITAATCHYLTLVNYLVLGLGAV